jgi:NhaP-type Na+/H+ or K+/H+ antiporter
MTLPNGASVVVPVVICICISYSMTSLAISRYKEVYGYNPWCHESSITALIGLLVGGAVKFFTGSAVEFDNDVFFYVVLPPIIFSAGLSLKKKMFFRYISLITLFGVMGTVINFSLITAVAYHATRMFDFRDNIFDRPVNLSWEHAMLLAAVLSGTGKIIPLSLQSVTAFILNSNLTSKPTSPL